MTQLASQLGSAAQNPLATASFSAPETSRFEKLRQLMQRVRERIRGGPSDAERITDAMSKLGGAELAPGTPPNIQSFLVGYFQDGSFREFSFPDMAGASQARAYLKDQRTGPVGEVIAAAARLDRIGPAMIRLGGTEITETQTVKPRHTVVSIPRTSRRFVFESSDQAVIAEQVASAEE